MIDNIKLWKEFLHNEYFYFKHILMVIIFYFHLNNINNDNNS